MEGEFIQADLIILLLIIWLLSIAEQYRKVEQFILVHKIKLILKILINNLHLKIMKLTTEEPFISHRWVIILLMGNICLKTMLRLLMAELFILN